MNGPPPPIDWDVGRYTSIAEDLDPVAAEVITLAGPAAGDSLLDVACGTGNAALRAARGGLPFTADSPEAFFAGRERDHPTLHWGNQLLAVRGVDPAPMYDRMLDALREHNEDPSAFRAASPYHVIELRN